MFTMICSFQKREETTLEHQYPMPDAPEPETCPSEEESLMVWSKSPAVPTRLQPWIQLRLSQPIPIEIRHTCPEVAAGLPRTPSTSQSIWIRAKGPLPPSSTLHQCVAAYASDHVFLSTALLAHGLHTFHPRVAQIATLCHSMWFHAPFKADEWMLFVMESPRTGGNRGLVFGRLYTRDGRLVVSCSQEGVIRLKRDVPARL